MTDFSQKVAKALDAPGMASDLSRLSRDQDRRVPYPARPTVVTAHADHDLEGLIPPGSVLLMFAPFESKVLRGIEADFIAGDSKSLRALQSEEIPKLLA